MCKELRATPLERERSTDLAEIVIQDVGLTFELLRSVNGSGQRGAVSTRHGALDDGQGDGQALQK